MDKQKNQQTFTLPPASKDCKTIVVIPAFQEKNLFSSLLSLSKANAPQHKAEVICVINYPEDAPTNIKRFHEKQYQALLEKRETLDSSFVKFHFILADNLPKKHAGVGLARKTGMDIAVQRFLDIQFDGMIVCFDADSTCEKNYWQSLEWAALNNDIQSMSIYFEHPIEGTDFPGEIYQAIISYELHLRYYKHALAYIGHPLAIYTVGSSMGVRASMYAKQGGMNKRKAGEDFYFLNKVAQAGGFYELKTTRVIPSPRISDRVPFGTGKAVGDMISTGLTNYYTYNFHAFMDLKAFFDKRISFYECRQSTTMMLYDEFPQSIKAFMKKEEWIEKITECQKHSASFNAFEKRFFTWWNTFKVMKFLHFAREKYYPDVPVKNAAEKLFNRSFTSEKEALFFLRKTDCI